MQNLMEHASLTTAWVGQPVSAVLAGLICSVLEFALKVARVRTISCGCSCEPPRRHSQTHTQRETHRDREGMRKTGQRLNAWTLMRLKMSEVINWGPCENGARGSAKSKWRLLIGSQAQITQIGFRVLPSPCADEAKLSCPNGNSQLEARHLALAPGMGEFAVASSGA